MSDLSPVEVFYSVFYSVSYVLLHDSKYTKSSTSIVRYWLKHGNQES
jgi:hypothetical protein